MGVGGKLKYWVWNPLPRFRRLCYWGFNNVVRKKFGFQIVCSNDLLVRLNDALIRPNDLLKIRLKEEIFFSYWTSLRRRTYAYTKKITITIFNAQFETFLKV